MLLKEVNLWRKRKAIIFENCTCKQVNKKNTAVKQRSPRSAVPTVDSICKKRQKDFLIHGELTEANKAL